MPEPSNSKQTQQSTKPEQSDFCLEEMLIRAKAAESVKTEIANLRRHSEDEDYDNLGNAKLNHIATLADRVHAIRSMQFELAKELERSTDSEVTISRVDDDDEVSFTVSVASVTELTEESDVFFKHSQIEAEQIVAHPLVNSLIIDQARQDYIKIISHRITFLLIEGTKYLDLSRAKLNIAKANQLSNGSDPEEALPAILKSVAERRKLDWVIVSDRTGRTPDTIEIDLYSLNPSKGGESQISARKDWLKTSLDLLVAATLDSSEYSIKYTVSKGHRGLHIYDKGKRKYVVPTFDRLRVKIQLQWNNSSGEGKEATEAEASD